VTFHQCQPVFRAGAPLDQASAALLMIHGRGASASDILSLAAELDSSRFACVAPQANGGAWYPYRFVEPVEKNEPYLTSALNTVESVLGKLNDAGIPPDRTIILGFSQGACLALEYAARNPRRYGGLVGLSGGLIYNGDRPRAYEGSLDGTPAFLGCSDVDFHIPLSRVRQSSETLRSLGAVVEERIYPGMDHTVNRDELDYVQQMMDRLLSPE
jgi:phospholipase/carboxylesterase